MLKSTQTRNVCLEFSVATNDFVKNFTAVDVELANNDLASICELGLAKFREGQLVETWRAVVNPESDFEVAFHSNLHGIRSGHVEGAPTFPEVYHVLKHFTNQGVCVFHAASGFDQNCLSRACERYALEDLTKYTEWKSTLQMAKNHWPDQSSYKLEALCKKIGHDYHPHNALEDAIAAAAILRAISGVSDSPAIAAVGGGSNRPRTFRRVASTRHEKGLRADPNGPFHNTYIVLTGIFSPPWDDRGGFEQYLTTLGFTPRGNISGKTEILVTGQSPGISKIKRAQQSNIRIMSEKEFLQYIQVDNRHLDH